MKKAVLEQHPIVNQSIGLVEYLNARRQHVQKKVIIQDDWNTLLITLQNAFPSVVFISLPVIQIMLNTQTKDYIILVQTKSSVLRRAQAVHLITKWVAQIAFGNA